jgi:hypothetical protein
LQQQEKESSLCNRGESEVVVEPGSGTSVVEGPSEEENLLCNEDESEVVAEVVAGAGSNTNVEQPTEKSYSVSQTIFCCPAGKDRGDNTCDFALCMSCYAKNEKENGGRARSRGKRKTNTCRCGKENTSLDIFVDSTYYKPVYLSRDDNHMPKMCGGCGIAFVA